MKTKAMAETCTQNEKEKTVGLSFGALVLPLYRIERTWWFDMRRIPCLKVISKTMLEENLTSILHPRPQTLIYTTGAMVSMTSLSCLVCSVHSMGCKNCMSGKIKLCSVNAKVVDVFWCRLENNSRDCLRVHLYFGIPGHHWVWYLTAQVWSIFSQGCNQDKILVLAQSSTSFKMTREKMTSCHVLLINF